MNAVVQRLRAHVRPDVDPRMVITTYSLAVMCACFFSALFETLVFGWSGFWPSGDAGNANALTMIVFPGVYALVIATVWRVNTLWSHVLLAAAVWCAPLSSLWANIVTGDATVGGYSYFLVCGLLAAYVFRGRFSLVLGTYIAICATVQAIFLLPANEVIRVVVSFNLLMIVCMVVLHHARNNAQADEDTLNLLTVQDPLTGLGNRRQLSRDLDALAQRPPGLISLMVIDVDGLKAVNDKFGHVEGDAMLQEVADALRAVFGSARGIYRLGGDEYLVILPISPAWMRRKASAVQAVLAASPRSELDGSPTTVTIGVAGTHEYHSFEDLYRLADQELYEDRRAREATKIVAEELR